jgi:hypothetical protein
MNNLNNIATALKQNQERREWERSVLIFNFSALASAILCGSDGE